MSIEDIICSWKANDNEKNAPDNLAGEEELKKRLASQGPPIVPRGQLMRMNVTSVFPYLFPCLQKIKWPDMHEEAIGYLQRSNQPSSYGSSSPG